MLPLNASPSRNNVNIDMRLSVKFQLMKYYRLILIPMVGLLVSTAWSQPAPPNGESPARSAPEQRRSELRSALQMPQAREVQEEKSAARLPPTRQLTAQERADLRLQLRQQHRSVNTDRP